MNKTLELSTKIINFLEQNSEDLDLSFRYSICSGKFISDLQKTWHTLDKNKKKKISSKMTYFWAPGTYLHLKEYDLTTENENCAKDLETLIEDFLRIEYNI